MKTKSAIITALFGIGILSAILVFGVERIKTQNELASSMQHQADAVAEANNLATSIRRDKEGAADNLATLDDITLSQGELVPFIELIEQTAKGMGLSVEIKSVNSETVKGAASTTPQPIHISIETSGGWSGNFGFIHALENLPQHVMVDSVDMHIDETQQPAASASTTTSRWKTQSTITTYIVNN